MKRRDFLQDVTAAAGGIGALLARPGNLGAEGAGTDGVTAIVGATLIDGNGGAPLPDATVVLRGQRIAAVGPRTAVPIPPGASRIDAAGKFLTPGLIDANVHLMGNILFEELFPLLFYGEKDPFTKYGYALEAAQVALKHGVTTIRDTYDPLPPMLALRDRLASGAALGPRLQVAGDILGFGGPFPLPIMGYNQPLTRRQEYWNDFYRGYRPVGERLTTMYPEQVRAAVNAYLDAGPDFVKYAATTHSLWVPVYIGFSPRVQRAIVEETHRRGKRVEVHSSSAEGHLVAVEAGIDTITHAGMLEEQVLSDEIVDQILARKVVCVLFTAFSAGPVYRARRDRDRLLASPAPPGQPDPDLNPDYNGARALPDPSGERRREQLLLLDVESYRRNDRKLIEAGAVVAVGTDSSTGPWPGIYDPGLVPPTFPQIGRATVLAVEGLVELGMTPGQAIVAATRNGAIAAGALDQFGTIEAGKCADLLILGADPLADIKNLRRLERVVTAGRVIDPATLPLEPRYYRR